MSDQNQTPAPVSIDDEMRRVREYTAAAIAGVVLLGTVIMFILAVGTTADAERFERVKDLINIVIPIVTFVLGYYFNKTTSDTRADKAESIAQTAAVSAQQAEVKKSVAEAEASQAWGQVEEIKGSLEEVTASAASMLESAPDGPGFLAEPAPSMGTLSGADEETREAAAGRAKQQEEWRRAKQDLELALARAKKRRK
jgi:hypothetical protein